ncbi:hypothetical protein, partial [Acinetobacter baumannii]
GVVFFGGFFCFGWFGFVCGCFVFFLGWVGGFGACLCLWFFVVCFCVFCFVLLDFGSFGFGAGWVLAVLAAELILVLVRLFVVF